MEIFESLFGTESIMFWKRSLCTYLKDTWWRSLNSIFLVTTSASIAFPPFCLGSCFSLPIRNIPFGVTTRSRDICFKPCCENMSIYNIVWKYKKMIVHRHRRKNFLSIFTLYFRSYRWTVWANCILSLLPTKFFKFGLSSMPM